MQDHAELVIGGRQITGWPASLIVIGVLVGLFAAGLLVGISVR